MSYYQHFHLPHYFASKIKVQIEHLYASMAIGNLAQAIIAIFEPIYLYHVAGLSVTEVLWFYAAVYALYIVTMVWGGKIAARVGYQHAIMYSIPFMVVCWFLILASKDSALYLVAAAPIFAIQKALFWPALHATMARFSDKQQLGREFSFLYAIMNLMQVVGPMLGGFLSMMFGIQAIFIIGSIIFFCSIIPLFMTHEKFKPKPYNFHDTWKLYKKYPARFLGYLGFGEELLVLTIWPIFIFTVIANYQDTGTLVTLATLFSTGLGLYIGFFTDKHSKQSLVRAGTLIYALTWLARIPVFSAFGVWITDALSRTAKSLVFIPTVALTYERAEDTHIMPYVIGAEQVLSLGKLLAALIGILVFAATGSFVALFIVGAIFTLFFFLL